MLATKMHQLGAAYYLGYITDLTQKQIADAIKTFINDYQLRKCLHSKAQTVVEGKGSKRCAEEIISLIKK